ncbi:MAG: EFR1 family ferrodoxin [Eubacteriales bacterium]
MLMLYFSGTGNSKYIAETFSNRMNALCYSIEEPRTFGDIIKQNEIIGFCFPTYGSRIPRIMRAFVLRHINQLKSKKLIIFCTQLMFSGDGARVFTDLLPKNHVEVIYAEHFNMPNNLCNFPVFKVTVVSKIP